MKDQKNDRQSVLRFTLSGRGCFGINVLKIREIIPYKPLNKLPGARDCIAGLIELRGKNIQVIDLSRAVGQPSLLDQPDFEASIIITEFNRSMQGLLLRHLDKIAAIEWNEVKEQPRASGGNHYLSGVINIDNQLVGLIDVEKVLYELMPELVEEKISEPFDYLKNKKILAVDDSKIARRMIAKTLDQIGAEYIMASSGKDALEIINEENVNIDMVISDIEMPLMDGYSLTRQIREQQQTKDCYVLLHSSLSGNACEAMSKEVGANAMLTKFSTEDLIAKIDVALNV